jgi:hypothetical protein
MARPPRKVVPVEEAIGRYSLARLHKLTHPEAYALFFTAAEVTRSRVPSLRSPHFQRPSAEAFEEYIKWLPHVAADWERRNPKAAKGRSWRAHDLRPLVDLLGALRSDPAFNKRAIKDDWARVWALALETARSLGVDLQAMLSNRGWGGLIMHITTEALSVGAHRSRAEKEVQSAWDVARGKVTPQPGFWAEAIEVLRLVHLTGESSLPAKVLARTLHVSPGGALFATLESLGGDMVSKAFCPLHDRHHQLTSVWEAEFGPRKVQGLLRHPLLTSPEAYDDSHRMPYEDGPRWYYWNAPERRERPGLFVEQPWEAVYPERGHATVKPFRLSRGSGARSVDRSRGPRWEASRQRKKHEKRMDKARRREGRFKAQALQLF